uniref:Putative conserved secreted protein n=2 Tax=Nyssomyia neivai TaxID=330878 RepID=A0A1L8DNP3_9DIPT
MASIYVYVKSAVWLIGCSALGYALLKVTEPREEKLRLIRATSSLENVTEDKRKTALALKKLREAVDDKPIYLKTRKEIEEDNRRNLGIDK